MKKYLFLFFMLFLFSLSGFGQDKDNNLKGAIQSLQNELKGELKEASKPDYSDQEKTFMMGVIYQLQCDIKLLEKLDQINREVK